MSQQAFYFDGTRCTGCKTCQMACKDYKNIDLGISSFSMRSSSL